MPTISDSVNNNSVNNGSVNNEEKILSVLETVASTVAQMQADISDLQRELVGQKQGHADLQQGQLEILTRLDNLETDIRTVIHQQNRDSRLIQSTFDQVVKLTEHQVMADSRLDRIEAVL